MKLCCSLLITITLLSCVAADKQGTVVRVIDGDTFDMLLDKGKTRVRLFGIDCPERGQAFNRKAKEFTEALIAGKAVRLVVHNKDRYGRSVADVYLDDGTYVNAAIVKAGFAWHFKRYSDDPAVANLEIAARKAKVGLWEDNKAIPPWEFRKQKLDH